MYLYYVATKVCPTRPFTMACLWPVVLMGLYKNQGQAGHYIDLFWASLVLDFFVKSYLLFHKSSSFCEEEVGGSETQQLPSC